jgi:hypothetical protein
VRGELRHGAVDYIASHGNQVRLQRIDRRHDLFHVLALDGRPNVNIADLHDRETVQRGGQVIDGDIHVLDRRTATRAIDAEQRHQHGEQGHAESAPRPESGPRIDGVLAAARQMQHKQHDVAKKRQHEQRGKKAHYQQSDPRETIRQRLLPDIACDHAKWNQHDGSHQREHREYLERGAYGRHRNQAHADIHVKQNTDADYADEKCGTSHRPPGRR